MISVVLYGRNDSYGYNLHKRAALSLNCMAELLTDPTDEILFVDYNTPNDFPTFPEAIQDTLTDRARKLLRILRVRPSVHARFEAATRLVALEPVARNVAVRRSSPSSRWILSTNTDIIFVPQRIASLSDVAKDLAPGFYHAPRLEIPEALWESLDRRNPRHAIDAVRDWGRTLFLDEIVFGEDLIMYDGPGDFQLIERSDLFKYHGFHEEMLLGWHVDSNIATRLRLVHGAIGDLGADFRAYHCDHTRQVTPMHSHAKTENDWRRFIRDVERPDIPAQAATWGCADDDIEEVRLASNFSQFYVKALQTAIGRPLVRPLIANYRSDAYNKVDYDPRHILPFLADMFLASPRSINVGWYGARAETLRLFARVWRDCGFTGRIFVADPVMEPAALAELRIDRVEHATLMSDSNAFILDFGDAGSATPGQTEGQSRIARIGDAVIARSVEVANHEQRRMAEGLPPRRVVAINVINNEYEDHIRSLIAAPHTPFSPRMRHGFVIPPVRRKENWLPLVQVGEAGVRAGQGIASAAGRTGVVAVGPNRHLTPGGYELGIRIAAAAGPAGADEPCVTVEAIYAWGVVGALTIRRSELNAIEHRFAFQVPDTPWLIGGLSIRVRAVAPVALTINELTIEPAATAGGSDRPYPLTVPDWLPFLTLGKFARWEGGGVCCGRGDAGNLTHGPYWTLPVGSYDATLVVEAGEADVEGAIAAEIVIDVAGVMVGGQAIACRSRGGPAPTTISIPFAVSDEVARWLTKTEIRIRTTGLAALRVRSVAMTARREAPPLLAGRQDWLSRMDLADAGLREGAAIKVAPGKTGLMMYGPYEFLRPGAYLLTIGLDAAGGAVGAPNEAVLLVEVRSTEGTLALRAIRRAELSGKEFEIAFDVFAGATDGVSGVELLVRTLAAIELSIGRLTMEQTAHRQTRPEGQYLLQVENWLPYLTAGTMGRFDGRGVDVDKGQAGIVLVGPGAVLQPGRYELVATIEHRDDEGAPPVLGWMDACLDGQRIALLNIASRAAGAASQNPATHTLPFVISPGRPANFDMRMSSDGAAAFRITSVSVKPLEAALANDHASGGWLTATRIGAAGGHTGDAIRSVAGRAGPLARTSECLPPGRHILKVKLAFGGKTPLLGQTPSVNVVVRSQSNILGTRVIKRSGGGIDEHSIPFDVPAAAAGVRRATEVEIGLERPYAVSIHGLKIEASLGAPEPTDLTEDWLPFLALAPAGRMDRFGAWSVRGAAGPVLVGPHWALPPGHYQMLAGVEWLGIRAVRGPIGKACVVTRGRELARRDFELPGLAFGRHIARVAFDFEIPLSSMSGVDPEPWEIETRIIATGTALFRVRSVVIRPCTPPSFA